jgi:serine protease
MSLRSRLLPSLLAASALAAALPTAARADQDAGPADARYRAGEVVVQYAPPGAHAASARSDDLRSQMVRVPRGESMAAALRRLRAKPGVVSAAPNMVAHISGWIPTDPGRHTTVGGWQNVQWNFMPGVGVDAPDAWAHLFAAGHPGGRGVTVAVVDTGVAYSNHGRFVASPDFPKGRFVKGWDFVDDDAFPNDENGHGTHVAGTIAEGTNNAVGVTGLAYGVKLMPVRVLDSDGEGDSLAIARGIRYAADHGAKVINLSFEFDKGVTESQIPDILSAIRHAEIKGSLVVGAAGNEAVHPVAYPARAAQVLSVGATTSHGCQASYSDTGQDLDVVAPGGGPDARLPGDPHCNPDGKSGRDIYQETFTHENGVTRFGLTPGYIGTSMAAPHASATAALVIASGILGPNPTPEAVAHRLEQTAQDFGAPGWDDNYGYGLINAAAATDPAIPVQ